MALCPAPIGQVESAADVARGVTRLFVRHDWAAIGELTLANGRRVDLCAICPRGTITIVEIKLSKADLLGDHKWTEYLDYCDRFFWAVPPGFDVHLFDCAELRGDRTGLIIADRYDGVITRPASDHPLGAARRKAVTLGFARRAAHRLIDLCDDQARPAA